MGPKVRWNCLLLIASSFSWSFERVIRYFSAIILLRGEFRIVEFRSGCSTRSDIFSSPLHILVKSIASKQTLTNPPLPLSTKPINGFMFFFQLEPYHQNRYSCLSRDALPSSHFLSSNPGIAWMTALVENWPMGIFRFLRNVKSCTDFLIGTLSNEDGNANDDGSEKSLFSFALYFFVQFIRVLFLCFKFCE